MIISRHSRQQKSLCSESLTTFTEKIGTCLNHLGPCVAVFFRRGGWKGAIKDIILKIRILHNYGFYKMTKQ